ncbi:Ig-like domain-containing protein [Bacillus sp. JJ664]
MRKTSYTQIIIAFILSFTLFHPTISSAATITGTINGTKLATSDIKTIKNKYYINIHTYFKSLGFTNTENKTNWSTFKNSNRTVIVYTKKNTVTVNGYHIPISYSPAVVKKKIFLEINQFPKISNVTLSWNSKKTSFSFLPIKPIAINIDPPRTVFLMKGATNINLQSLYSKIKSVGSIKSSNPSVVTVDDKGVLRGINEGMATITITIPNEQPYKTLIKVFSPREFDFNYNNNLQVKVDEKSNISLSLKYSDRPLGELNFNVTYASQDSNIASVSSTGEVKGISTGNTTVYVKIDSITLPISVSVE